MRLLQLPDEVRADLAAGSLTMGHARTLLSLPDAAAQRHAAREVISRALSVPRHRSAGQAPLRAPGGEGRAARTPPDVHTRAAEDRCASPLGAKVKIVAARGRWTIEIAFDSETELNRLYTSTHRREAEPEERLG
jgi:ParB family chromosome partitioning protein